MLKQDSKKKADSLRRLSSRIDNIYVPLPHFEFFHKASGEGGIDRKFVGRERISDRLKNYLKCEGDKNLSGTYLITGYRGMGKSSLVGKVVSDIIEEESGCGKNGCRLKKGTRRIIHPENLLLRCVFVIAPFVALLMMLCFGSLDIQSVLCYTVVALSFYAGFILLYKDQYRSRKIHYIHLNLGGEINSERDVLSLIVSAMDKDFLTYMNGEYQTNYRFFCARLLRSVAFSVVSLIIFVCLSGFAGIMHEILRLLCVYFPGRLMDFISGVNTYIYAVLTANMFVLAVLKTVFAMVAGMLVMRWIIYPLTNLILRFFDLQPVTAKQIKKDLSLLDERIHADIDEDNDPYGSLNTAVFGITLKKKRIRKYIRATTPEIEQELIRIINLVNESAFIHDRFIIVLDELDKMGGGDAGSETPDTHDAPEFSYNTGGFPGTGSSSAKKRDILSLLGRLKFFVTTAQAKFVFISGHELFDAHLADVSDREFSISSTFSGIINVESFFTPDSAAVKDVTRMTEIYVANLLMTDAHKQSIIADKDENKLDENDDLRLGRFHKAVEKHIEEKDDKDWIKEKKQQLDRTVAFLRQFITYLTFVSNGAPKKMTTFFEKYVISYDEYIRRKFKGGNKLGNETDAVTDSGYLEDIPGHAPYYLCFGYYDQQKIGFIHYIAHPIFHSVINPYSEFGDKLLVSSSFLIAHIYKHHSNAFSWRNIEYLPELLDSHRTPELRNFITSMLGYLEQMHITRISYGLYQYKFPMRLVEEISIFTKKSEEVSAIFNFSLDELRAVKRYYSDLLAYYEAHYPAGDINIANIHNYLGDLHLANEEYTEAIAQYRVTTDILQQKIRKITDNNDPLKTSYMVRYIRTMLKLGLAYEKRNTVDSAYLVYNDLVVELINHRNIEEKSFPLECSISENASDTDQDWFGLKLQFFNRDSKGMMYYGDDFSVVYPVYRSIDAFSNVSKIAAFEELRLVYLPVLSKLFAVEKQHTGGITEKNVMIAEDEFRMLYLLTNHSDKYLLAADFFRKLGDILYYKNGNSEFYMNTLENLLSLWEYDIKREVLGRCRKMRLDPDKTHALLECISVPTLSIYSYFDKGGRIDTDSLCALITSPELPKNLIKEVFKNIVLPGYIAGNLAEIERCRDRRAGTGKYIKAPCFACKYYNRSLRILKKVIDTEWLKEYYKSLDKDCSFERIHKCVSFLLCAMTGRYRTKSRNEISQTAHTLEAMGNIMFSCADERSLIRTEFIEALVTLEQNEEDEKDENKFNNFASALLKMKMISQLEKAFLYYWAAAEFHYNASNVKEATHCITNILNELVAYIGGCESGLIKDMPSYDTRTVTKLIGMLKNRLVVRALRGIYANKDFYNLQEIKSIKKDFGKDDGTEWLIPLSYISCAPDMEDIVLAFYEIQLMLTRLSVRNPQKCDFKIGISLLAKIYDSIPLTSSRCESLIYNRIISLFFKANLNSLIFSMLLDGIVFDDITEMFEAYARKKDGNPDAKRKLRQLFESVSKMLAVKKDNDTSEILKQVFNVDVDMDSFWQVVEFIVEDSTFCLLQITESLNSAVHNSTLFTNNFCSMVYGALYSWNTIRSGIQSLEIDCSKKYRADNDRPRLLAPDVEQKLSYIYLQEMEAKYRNRSIEINSEGDMYQSFIDSFYMQDDDLQNDSCQYYLALERYRINIGAIDPRNVDYNRHTRTYDAEFFFPPRRKDYDGKLSDAAVYNNGSATESCADIDKPLIG